MDELNERYQFSLNLVASASTYIKEKMLENLEINIKNNDPADLVTNLDTETERFLIKAITEQFPADTFLTEEKTEKFIESRHLWIIDPIDGTMNFAYLGCDFAISLAYYENSQPVFGIVMDVMKQEVFHGFTGQGSFCNQTPLAAEPRKLKDSIIDLSMNSVRQMHNFNYDLSDLDLATLSQRNLGSAALSICHTAANRIHGYINAHLKIWDYAAAMIILHEAGGICTIPNHEGFPLSDMQAPLFALNSPGCLEEIMNNFHR